MRKVVVGFIGVCVWLSVVWLLAEHKEKERSFVQYELLETFWMRKQSAYEQKLAELEQEVEKGETIYSAYRGTTILDENSIHLQPYEPNPKHAIVTMMGGKADDDPYWMGAIALIQSLREVKTRVPNIVVIVRSEVPSFVYAIIYQLGATLMHGPALRSTWMYDSMRVWGLTNFERVLFIDVNNIVVQNIDHLLNEKGLSAPFSSYQCGCVWKTDEICRVNSNFFVCEPSAQRLKAIRASDTINEIASSESPFMYTRLIEEIAKETNTSKINLSLSPCIKLFGSALNNLGWKYAWPVGLCVCPDVEDEVLSYQFEYWGVMPWENQRLRIYSKENGHPCVLHLYHLWFRFVAKAMNSVVQLNEDIAELESKIQVDNVEW